MTNENQKMISTHFICRLHHVVVSLFPLIHEDIPYIRFSLARLQPAPVLLTGELFSCLLPKIHRELPKSEQTVSNKFLVLVTALGPKFVSKKKKISV